MKGEKQGRTTTSIEILDNNFDLEVAHDVGKTNANLVPCHGVSDLYPR